VEQLVKYNNMEVRETLGNNVMVKLDAKNDYIETKSGLRLLLDTSFEPEKHVVRVGTVEALPRELQFKKEIPWETEIELKLGDRVVMYFMAIQNCLSKEQKKYAQEGKDVYIFIKYHNIYAIIRGEEIIPINGYVLVEPIEDPEWIRLNEQASKAGLIIPDMRKLSKTHITYGKIAYLGKPNLRYSEKYKSDEYYDLKVGDEIIMKKIRDIPVEYEYHAKMDGGRKLYRMQRHDILAVL
jgi:co-chaperonin GroES (HSP10)